VSAATKTGDPVLDGISHAVSTKIEGIQGTRIDRVDHHAWQESYYITDGTRVTRINIGYNGRGIVGNITPVPRDEFGVEIANQLSEIKGLRFTGQVSSNTQAAQFTRDVFNDFFPLFSKNAVSNGLQIFSVTEEAWNLRIVLASATARGELAIYCDGKGNIKNPNWIGRPPSDQSLLQGLAATLADL